MVSLLTEEDKTLLHLARRENGGFHIAAEWYFRGFVPMGYQYAFHQATVPNVTLIAGIASGKTTIVASSFLMDCLTIPYFKALNTSVTAKQAELPYEMVIGWIEENQRIEHLIEDISLRPYPLIKFKNFSEFHFRTMGNDARFIRGQEFDRINVDEAGLDYNGGAIKVLRGRLRGTRLDGSQRMARLDVITSPTGAPWLRERFDRGWKGHSTASLKRYLSMRVSTYENVRLTREQIALMEADYPEEMIDVELRGMFPDYGVSMFPIGHINACVDQSMYDAVYMALNPETGKPKPGYDLMESPRFGIMKFEMPVKPGRMYILAGDPGIDNPPRRNSPVVMVADVTEVPYKIVYFDWVSARGSYMPFLNSFKYAINKYYPVYRGIDTTGPQKAIDELAFENMGIDVDGIAFNHNKGALLNSLSLMISNQHIKYPPIKGLLRQMGTYTEESDRQKAAQDIVMTLAIVAYLARFKPDEVRSGPVATTGTKDRNARSRRGNRR